MGNLLPWLRLQFTPGLGRTGLMRLIEHCGTPEKALDAAGLGWTTEISTARKGVGDKIALQGNMDPSTLYASPERIRQEVQTILTDFGPGSGHVFNLGHGIHQHIDPDNVKVLVDAVHELSRPLHG